ncbi:MAG: glycosyltransferase family 39 protein [Pseudomonadota bacterium]
MLDRFIAFVEDEPWMAALGFSLLVTALRYLHLSVVQTDLGADEAQYWFWGQELAFGYYSKPPMIAWIIRLSTEIFGETVFGVRALSPLFLAGTGLSLFAVGRKMFGDKAGLSTLLLWHIMPAVIYGGTLISTDIPLLFFWSLALFFLVKIIEAPRGTKSVWGLALGAAWGLAFLSKYAAIYFLIGLALAFLTSRYVRRGLTARSLILACLVAGAVISPNVLWNGRHGFQTVRHTADNAQWSGLSLHLRELSDFFIGQFAVAGPLLFGILLFGLVRYRFRADPKERFLVSMTLPPLIMIACQALLSRAHANWAITAYPAALLLLPVWLLRMQIERLVLPAAVLLHGAAWLIFVAVTTDFQRTDAWGFSSAVKRERAWGETADAIRAALPGYDGLILDDREIAAHLIWELRDDAIDIEVFDNNGRLNNTYELAMPFEPRGKARRLLITKVPDEAFAAYGPMGARQPAGVLFIDLHTEKRGRKERTLDLYTVNR